MDNINAKDIANFLNEELIGENITIVAASSFSSPKKNTIVFTNKKFDSLKISDVLVICSRENYEKSKKEFGTSFLISNNPRLSFAKVLQKFFFENDNKQSIHRTAVIAKDTDIHSSVSIGSNCVIESGVIIKEGTIIMNNVVISKNVKIGKFCFIKSGSVIGEDGFGFDFEEDNTPIRIPHLGSVIINDNVEIGSICTIQKGTIDNTVINSNVKLSDHVHIAHNCFIEKNCIIAAHAQICGSVKIGKNCWIGANCSIMQSKKIGDNATIGIGSVIINDIEDNVKIMGLEGLDLINLKKIKKKINFGKF